MSSDEALLREMYATQFERRHPLVRTLAAALFGLTERTVDAALDAAFIAAAAI